MIHGVRLKAGHASYCNRWVRTERLAQEERAGWALCNKIGDYQGFRALLHMARARLAQALGLDGSGDPVDNQGPAVFVVGPRVAFTVRLDPTRHGRLRQVAASQSRSAQQVLVEAFDRYIAGSAGTTSRSATLSSPSTASTGNQP